VLDRPNADFSQTAMAAQRRRRHQSNREAFADALAAAARWPRGAVGSLPASFTEAVMVLGHATALRAAAGSPR